MPEGSLLRWAKKRGYQVSWGPLEVAAIAYRDVAARGASGEIDPAFYAGNFSGFREGETGGSPTDRVLAVVMPRPAHSVAFDFHGRPRTAIIPPTYVRYTPLFEEVARDLAENALPPGSRLKRVNVPLKALAVRLGLVRYGRNNLTYAPAFGSSIQLFAYFTDAPLPIPEEWRPTQPELLPICETCTACLDACPTGAICGDRLLLHGERCLTWLNENPGPWPSWLAAEAHNSLVGCLNCQNVCPENAGLTVADTGVSFTAEETDAIMNQDPAGGGPVWGTIRLKLDQIGRLNEEPVLGRNLRALFATEALTERIGDHDPLS